VSASTLEAAISGLRDALELAKLWRSRYFKLEEVVRKALRCLEKGDAGTARKILAEALSAEVVEE
jgi:hypothetical protein